MDIWSLKEYQDELQHQLRRLKLDTSVNDKVPTIVTLVEMEVPRLIETMLSMKPNEVCIDKDGKKLIKSVTNVFDLRDSESMNALKNRLAQELRVIKFCFHPALDRIVSFVSIVIHHLERPLSSSDTTEGPISESSTQRTDERPQSKYQEAWVEYAFDLKIDETSDSNGNQFVDTLRKISICEDDIKKLVFQKCNEVVKSCERKLPEGDRGDESGSEHE